MLAGYLVCSVRRRGAMCWDQMLPDLRTQCEPAGPPWANGIDRQACFLGGVGDMGRSSFGYLKQHPLNVVTNGCNASAFITSPWTWGTLFFPLLAFAACFAMSSELERVRTEVNPLVWVSSGEPCLCASPFISVGSPDPSFTLRYLSENPLIDFVSLYKIREADVRNQK